MLAQANALVKDRQSGQGQTQWKRRVADGSGELSQGEGGAERIVDERSILTTSFPEFIHELLFGSAQGTGCCLK